MPDGPGNGIATLSPDYRVVVADSCHWVTQRRTDLSHHEKKETKPAVKKAVPATKKAAPAKKKKSIANPFGLDWSRQAAHHGR